MYIEPTKEVKEGSIFDIHEDAMDILLYPASEDVPCPWDADIIIKDGEVILSGGLGPGFFGGAKCICNCTIGRFSQFYKLEVPEDNEELIDALTSAGWEVV